MENELVVYQNRTQLSTAAILGSIQRFFFFIRVRSVFHQWLKIHLCEPCFTGDFIRKKRGGASKPRRSADCCIPSVAASQFLKMHISMRAAQDSFSYRENFRRRQSVRRTMPDWQLRFGWRRITNFTEASLRSRGDAQRPQFAVGASECQASFFAAKYQCYSAINFDAPRAALTLSSPNHYNSRGMRIGFRLLAVGYRPEKNKSRFWPIADSP